jgi:hypothetical protein
MQVTRNDLDTAPGPSDWFTGSVYFDTVVAASAGSRLSAVYVHYPPRRADGVAHAPQRPDDPPIEAGSPPRVPGNLRRSRRKRPS